FLLIYLLIISIISCIITIYDKHCAIRGRWRVKEFTLLLLSIMGGSVFMYLTMLAVRHKTRKPKFMIGIPIIIICQIGIIIFVRMAINGA
ncbi:MAG: DUF1294 domain-containing protein, partial [Ruminococcus sp.]